MDGCYPSSKKGLFCFIGFYLQVKPSCHKQELFWFNVWSSKVMELETQTAKLTSDLDKFGGASRMKAALGSAILTSSWINTVSCRLTFGEDVPMTWILSDNSTCNNRAHQLPSPCCQIYTKGTPTASLGMLIRWAIFLAVVSGHLLVFCIRVRFVENTHACYLQSSTVTSCVH